MKIQRFRFLITLNFNPPKGGSVCDVWDGEEFHEEEIWASNERVAERAIKPWIMKKIGQQKSRLAEIYISVPFLVDDCSKSPL